MGEAPPAAFVDSVCRGRQTSLVVADKLCVLGGDVHDPDSSLSVRFQTFRNSTPHWVYPTVLGTKPAVTSHHWSVPIGNDRILVIKNGTTADDTFWFLEVDTPFVKQQKQFLGSDVVAWSKGVKGYAGKPIVISGPSGVGKGTLISKLMNDFPSMFGFSVSHTTRPPREMEVNGTHYHFTERSVMERDIKDGKFLEFASVHGNLYGTSVEAVEMVADAGKRCILDIDVQGARAVRASSLDAIFIFVCPPSFEDLEKRLRSRGTETEEHIQKRLRNAKGELEQGKSPGLFDHILVNDDLEACYKILKNLLCLNEVTDHLAPRPKGGFPALHSVTKVGSKLYLHAAAVDGGNAPHHSFVLDVGSLIGGAPGRTRGLELHPIH
ncbi:hypothetical protein RND81_14G034800 [Saponaria officinalis]|uniref:Guanylate kinase 1 n=1 Tax=Saponaria officinalis TaxID=3572 RepID=A0AAW1GS36_SAPOF